MTRLALHCLLQAVAAPAAVAADLLVSSVGRGLVLVACVALLLRCVPRLSAAMRSAVWTAVLLAVLLFPVLLLRTGPVAPGASRSVLHAGAAWSLLIAGAWVVLSLLRLLQLGASALRLRAVARRAVPVVANDAVCGLLEQSARRIQLCVSADVSRPSVAGFFRARILLPMGMLEQLSEPELQHVIVHEMEHLRRRDDWTNLLQKVGLAVFPLHPALLWLDRRLCAERELACDDGVLRATQARKTYAACLARLAEDSMMRRGLSLALGLLGGKSRRSELSGRVHRILSSPVSALGRGQVVVASAVLLASIAAVTGLLARSPQWISFGGVEQTRARPLVAEAPAAEPVLAAAQPVDRATPRAVLAKAIMPQRATVPGSSTAVRRAALWIPVGASARDKVHPLRDVAAGELPQPASAPPYVVFTAWQSTTTPAHMTVAVASYGQQAQVASATASPQAYTTYAAVPVQGGWLLIQL